MIVPLFTVEGTFTIKGRGLVLLGITIEQYGSVKAGDRITIERPDGSTIRAVVKAVEYPAGAKWIGDPLGSPVMECSSM